MVWLMVAEEYVCGCTQLTPIDRPCTECGNNTKENRMRKTTTMPELECTSSTDGGVFVSCGCLDCQEHDRDLIDEASDEVRERRAEEREHH